MSDEAAKTEPSLARIITSPSDNELQESASELRWAAKSLSATMNTDPGWAAVQATLRQMTSENAVNAILDRQQAAMAGILNRLAPGDWQGREFPDRPSTKEMEEAEADLRSQLPEIARQLPEVKTAAEKIATDREKRQAIERISAIVREVSASKLSPFALLIVLWWACHQRSLTGTPNGLRSGQVQVDPLRETTCDETWGPQPGTRQRRRSRLKLARR